MRRRNFIAGSGALTLGGMLPGALAAEKQLMPSGGMVSEIYELRKYTLTATGRLPFDQYWHAVTVPALTRNGARCVGVFEELTPSDPAYMYVLVVYPSWNEYLQLSDKIATDDTFMERKQFWDNIPSQDKPFERYDTWILEAFSGFQQLLQYDITEDRIFEMRTYEGYNEDAVRRKVGMFNNEEIDIFRKTGLHPVFFSKMVAGPQMPALTYLLKFKDMAERDANWKVFVDSPDWKGIKDKPEYAETVSKIIQVFLKPTSYSQI